MRHYKEIVNNHVSGCKLTKMNDMLKLKILLSICYQYLK